MIFVMTFSEQFQDLYSFLSQSSEESAANINNCIRTNKYNHLSDEYQKLLGKKKGV